MVQTIETSKPSRYIIHITYLTANISIFLLIQHL